MRKRSLILTDQELEVMKILWDRGEAPVRDVYEELRLFQPVSYTTVLTMLGVLEGKQHVEMIASETGATLYRAARPKEDVVDEIVSDFVARVFDGSGKELVEKLMKSGEVGREELAELSRPPSSDN